MRTAAAKNVAASYLAFISTALWGLASIPLAVAYLEPEQIGLWTIIYALLSYLAWADLGIAAATGRLIAKAITDKDQNEMNQWWTAIQTALLALGFIAISIGLLLMLFITYFIEIPEELVADTKLLLGGGALILGLTFPIRGVAGILTAEHRYHWAPLVQAVSPWINLTVFVILLQSGLGLKAYLFAFLASQVFNWISYKALIAAGPNQFNWDRSGLCRKRFKSLFGFSGNIALTGGVESLMRTLPNLLLAKITSLAVVPAYNFSSRASVLGSSLLNQTIRSFHPGLQRSYLTGEKEVFKRRHQQVFRLSLSMAITGASAVLLVNHMMVQILAGQNYYTGHSANTWFAISLITAAFSSLFRILLPISGHMGKAALISALKAPTAIVASILLWPHKGITGLAAIFALLPLVDGIYAYHRGARNCGYKNHELSRFTITITLLAIVLTWVCGTYVEQHSNSCMIVKAFDKELKIPELTTLLAPLFLGAVGLLLGAWEIRQVWRQLSTNSPRTQSYL